MDLDFSFFLVIATFLSGIIWGGYLLLGKSSAEQSEPFWVDYARSFFPVLLVVLLLRSFLVEPFRIPSASMMPTLLIGDFILVNKFAYGVRLPIFHTKIIEVSKPNRGDIVVFRFPGNLAVNYIKRVVGLPGDLVSSYRHKIYINGKPIKQTTIGPYKGVGRGRNMTGSKHLLEYLTGIEHGILLQNSRLLEWVYSVPKGHYFVMGDNRDNSNDSRYWGAVAEQHLVGKAFFVWMNWDWQHKGVGFDRIGTKL